MLLFQVSKKEQSQCGNNFNFKKREIITSDILQSNVLYKLEETIFGNRLRFLESRIEQVKSEKKIFNLNYSTGICYFSNSHEATPSVLQYSSWSFITIKLKRERKNNTSLILRYVFTPPEQDWRKYHSLLKWEQRHL